jgi:drug/metabolite transporter (DMT)-like permease
MKWKIVLAFAALYFIWGSTYIAILYAIKDIPPFFMSSARFLFAGTILFVWSRWKGDKAPGLIAWKKNSVYGILMLFGGTVSVTWAEQYLPSSLASIIVTAVPFWFILLDKKQWSYYFSNKMILAGLLVGFIGVAMLLSHEKSNDAQSVDSGTRFFAAVFIIFGNIAWVTGSLLAKYNPTNCSLTMNGGMQLLAAGGFSAIVGTVGGEMSAVHVSQISVSSWLGLAYLAIVGSIVAYLSYLWLLKVRPPAQVSTYVYVNPIVALLLGAGLAGEKITGWQILALGIILGGLLLVNIPSYLKLKRTSI